MLLEIDDVSVFVPAGRGAPWKYLLEHVSFLVAPGEHWALLGPNGAGKSTLVSLAAGLRHPSTGRVRLLGSELGRVDLRVLRRRVGLVDGRMALPGHLEVGEVVRTGATNTVQPQPEQSADRWRSRAGELLELVSCSQLTGRLFGSLSAGEQARIRVARALMSEPELLLLDEPVSGLDLPGREDLLEALARLAAERPQLASVTVAHGLEELPPTIDRALLLAGGRVVAAGAAEDVLAAPILSSCFGRRLTVERRDGRWSARATRGASTRGGELEGALGEAG